MSTIQKPEVKKISDCVFEVSRSSRPDMLVPARIFTTEKMLEIVLQDRSLLQISNVATLPGIQMAALAMPDVHEGYGFPIGGVAATAVDEGGVVSPGGIGYDINCGVRLLSSNVEFEKAKEYIDELATEIFKQVPSGVGKGGDVVLSDENVDLILEKGAGKALELGYGIQEDITRCEEEGCMPEAESIAVSNTAKKRGRSQLGTLGSGNHFLEIQEVKEIFDEEIAENYGLKRGTLTAMIHCGSRGLGHQVCQDYVNTMLAKTNEWGVELVDRELVYSPLSSPEGKQYIAAMSAAANFAWANRHIIAHGVRNCFKRVLGKGSQLNPVYDVAHNVGKFEEHMVDGVKKNLFVHRKGATRAFAESRPENCCCYKKIGHPVLIPGTMGTASYVLVGTEKGLQVSFGSTCHGAGRAMSRKQARKSLNYRNVLDDLKSKGITLKCASNYGISEEAPDAYKDVHSVVDVVVNAGIARKVAKLVPVAVIKGN